MLVKDSSFLKGMVMDENNIVIVNCLDEKSHQHHHGRTVFKYRHGNVSVCGDDRMSFSPVFRLV